MPAGCPRLRHVGSGWTRTMKQSFASRAKLRGGGHILGSALQPWAWSCHRHLGSLSAPCASARPIAEIELIAALQNQAHGNCRSSTPRWQTPVVTMRHNAISSFRASATIIVVLRAPLGPSVRVRYHCARPLPFWNMRNRQASWINPRRTRPLPDLASPFSRRLEPLSSGEPVRPA